MITETMNQSIKSNNKKIIAKKKCNLIIEDNDDEENVVVENKLNIDKKINLLNILNIILEKISLKELANLLNISTGTIVRWKELNEIPKNYEFELLKIAKIKIDYSKYTSKQKDQFFTPIDTAKLCFDIFKNEIEKYNENIDEFYFIEPSAGDGSFLNILPDKKTIAFDIEPRNKNIIEKDYLDWKPDVKRKYVVFGNPPFGLRGHLALKFINHSYDFAEYVCFILPQLFESDGKGVPRKRVKGYNLIYSEKIESNFYEPNNNILKINTIFQIWSKNQKNEEFELKDFKNENIKIYSLSDGGTISSTRNKDMIGKCDVYIPSTCFGKENMRCYDDFEKLPGRKGYGLVFNNNKQKMLNKILNTNLNEIAFLSTNSALNLRSSQIYSIFE